MPIQGENTHGASVSDLCSDYSQGLCRGVALVTYLPPLSAMSCLGHPRPIFRIRPACGRLIVVAVRRFL